MTTKVIVEAHLSTEKEVIVTIKNGDSSNIIVLQDGEKTEQVVFDDREITVVEVAK